MTARSCAVPPEAALASWTVAAPDVAPISTSVTPVAFFRLARTAAVVADVARLNRSPNASLALIRFPLLPGRYCWHSVPSGRIGGDDGSPSPGCRPHAAHAP